MAPSKAQLGQLEHREGCLNIYKSKNAIAVRNLRNGDLMRGIANLLSSGICRVSNGEDVSLL